MARRKSVPEAEQSHVVEPAQRTCAACGRTMWVCYHSRRTVRTLAGLLGLTLKVRRCVNEECTLFKRPYRPEEEGRLALPGHEFGLDVVALVGALRHAEHRSVPEIHRALRDRGLDIAGRTVTNLLDRYEELLAVSLRDDRRLQRLTRDQGRAILAIDGLAPDVGHEVLWVVRDCISGEVLRASSLLSATQNDLAALLRAVADALTVPVAAVVSDGQRSIRKAVGKALPGVPHQLCHFHYLREAARPVYEADRHAKKELKKRVRGVRPIERAMEARDDDEADTIRGYCQAVRSAITTDGRPPLDAPGLVLHERLSAVADSLDRVGEKGGGFRRN